MRYVGIIVAVLAAWGGLTLLTTHGLSPKSVDNPLAKYETLVMELHQANTAYQQARDATSSAPGGDKGAPFSAAPDPRVEVLRRMDRLAEKTLGTADGAEIALGVFDWSWRLDADLERLVDRFARLVEHYPNHPDLVDPVGTVAEAYAASGSPQDWTALLDKLARTTTDDDLRIGSLFIKGRVQINAGLLDQAKATLNHIVKTYAKSAYIPRVTGLLYEVEHLQPGMAAPEFVTKTLDGETVALASFRGKVVLLNFWATWCPSCMAEIPHLRKAYEQFHGDGQPFEIINVSLDEESSMPKTVVKSRNMPGIPTWERKDGASPVGKLYNVYGLPSWFLIDKEGVIRARDTFGDQLAPSVAKLLD